MIEEIFCDNPIIINKLKYDYFNYNSIDNRLELYINHIDWGSEENKYFIENLCSHSIGKQLLIYEGRFTFNFIRFYSKRELCKFIDNRIKLIKVTCDYKNEPKVGSRTPNFIALGYYVTIEFD